MPQAYHKIKNDNNNKGKRLEIDLARVTQLGRYDHAKTSQYLVNELNCWLGE